MSSFELAQPWRKLLYVKQGFPDNYVDETFLDALQKNVNVRAHKYWPTVLRTCAVSQHISGITAFIAVFVHLYSGVLAPDRLMMWDAVTFAVGYVAWDVMAIGAGGGRRRFSIARRVLLIALTLLLLTPTLKTLTLAISSDTIWALSAIMFLFSLVFHDYGSTNSLKVRFPDSLSINAGIFASILLASRLPSNTHVLGLMLFAVLVFALLPVFRRTCRAKSTTSDIIMSTSLITLTTLLFAPISHSLMVWYLAGMVCVNFGCPWWLIRTQKYKSEIRGPWDEARIIKRLSSLDEGLLEGFVG
ncbi:phosphatidylinositol N-acetylglucosaminyltransferase subunit C [Fimicolochytrium jonesii]|uniref:phosphatidylinositol N-acetylglucosaminyltransferase subunit C n=1 Tax=Fimicolochytrium jonesii TaxID=1396493 RepID=UPI0022FECCBD|nr:phosphatidylinositol N-acetylglucosaminyltransferase subunit C [Fimicolochytrium jonesii]KAI8826824.1 phosphatidylinositol N-acetylglucosaminyltransferase subunit C [Fimicolochytrium jonesii]